MIEEVLWKEILLSIMLIRQMSMKCFSRPTMDMGEQISIFDSLSSVLYA